MKMGERTGALQAPETPDSSFEEKRYANYSLARGNVA
jgi:hypothetical protein